jgi:hypothetical protein
MTEHWGLRRRLCRAPALLSIGLLIALVSVGLAACGYQGSNPGSSPSTQPQAQVTHSPTQVTPSQTQVQKCGIVQGLGSLEAPVGVTGAEQVENCFWQAFQHCHPATLVFITSSPGMTLTRTFTIHNNNGTCSVSDAMQQRIASNPPSPAGTYTCAGLTQQPGELLFSACGQDGDVVVSG